MVETGAVTTGASGRLLEWVELERIDRDIFRGQPTVWPREGSLYGGLVAAQALMAAARTVPAGREPHSLHGYYLRAGDPKAPVVYSVDRDRDGRSFSARRVAAIQDGQVIWDMACSFHEPVDGPEYSPPADPSVRPPDTSAVLVDHSHPILDIRVPQAPSEGDIRMPIDQAWIRVNVALPDDVLLHACMHTYASDATTGFGRLAVDGVPAAGPSIDHALWFHRITRADDWIFYDCSAQKVGAHRGLYTGTVHDLDGNLVAILAQEMLLRPPRPARALG
jgi:acyl-CoA thioesterase-2